MFGRARNKSDNASLFRWLENSALVEKYIRECTKQEVHMKIRYTRTVIEEREVEVGDLFINSDFDTSKPISSTNVIYLVRVISDKEVIRVRNLTETGERSAGYRILSEPIHCLTGYARGYAVMGYRPILREEYDKYRREIMGSIDSMLQVDWGVL